MVNISPLSIFGNPVDMLKMKICVNLQVVSAVSSIRSHDNKINSVRFIEPSICVWLNGIKDAEKPIWKKLWNKASLRYCTDGAANYIIKRSSDLKLPSVVSGDFDSIEETTKQFLEKKVRVIEMPDQDKTDLTKCLELILIDTTLSELGVHRILIDQKLITGKSGIVPFCQIPTIATTRGFKWELSKPL
uniref:TPK_catalytic domain-containing protein n=1 Tax=Heterorhabditis bacteriophora TaxID=37862 RepID=A0A1I7X4Q4_HETBA